MHRRARAALLSILVLAAVAPAAAAQDPGVRAGHSALKVPCGPQGTTLPADWYAPAGRRSTGVVWLQHGFLRTRRNLATLARSLAGRAGAVVVAATVPSLPLGTQRCWINGAPLQRAVAALFGGRRAALRASAAQALGGRGRLPRPFVLAGHSAGGNLATAAAGFLTADRGTVTALRGVVMLDGVDADGSIGRALARLSGPDERPVLQLAAAPSPCNAGGAGTQALVAARPGRFAGVQLAGGTHVDAEGPDGDGLARLVCGQPLAGNVQAVRTIAGSWVRNLLTGSSGGITGGAPGERIAVGGATAIVLPAG